MTLSSRDKKLLMIVLPLVVVLGYWFVLMAPKREAVTAATVTLEAEQLRLAEVEARASTIRTAKANFARDYSEVVALGKAIPTSVDMPSLLVQLEQAARGTGIVLEGVTAGERASASSTGGGTGAPTAGTPVPGAPGAPAPAADAGADPASAPAAAVPGTTSTRAPAAEGPLESVALEFKFKGSFFELANFFHRLKRFVYVQGETVRVRGRLMTIESVKYTTDPATFPALSATVDAKVFLSPKTQGTTAGATPAGPAPAALAPAASTSAASTSSPTPTAAATP